MRCFLPRAEAPVEEPTLLALTQARVVTPIGSLDYIHWRQHSSLGYRASAV